MSTPSISVRGRRWHLWGVAILTLLWNGSGAVTILMAQAGGLADMDAEEAAYYAAQPSWFVVATDIALFAPLVGAVALLLRSGTATWFFALSLIAILFNDAYDLLAGTSLALRQRDWLILTVIIVLIAAGQFAYAYAMGKRGALR
jgi:hypothetical protein